MNNRFLLGINLNYLKVLTFLETHLSSVSEYTEYFSMCADINSHLIVTPTS